MIDTREQKPFDFAGLTSDAKKGRLPVVVECEAARLPTGDYSIKGLETEICIERKSPEDLIKTLTRRRNEFFAELKRMRSFKQALIVVEADWKVTIDMISRISQANPKSIARTILAIQQDYPTVQWAFMPDRTWAMKYTFQFLKRFHERHESKHEDLLVGELCAEDGIEGLPGSPGDSGT